MTGKGHTQVGIAFSISVAYGTYVYLTEQSIVLSILAAFFTIIGATAPDWLEIRKKSGGTVITHRTITHWFPIWVALIYFAVVFKESNGFNVSVISDHSMAINAISATFIAFSVGCLLHLATDLPNPLGIPFLTPYHRISLKLWKSGQYEIPIIVLSYLASILWIGVDSEIIIIDVDKIIFLILNVASNFGS